VIQSLSNKDAVPIQERRAAYIFLWRGNELMLLGIKQKKNWQARTCPIVSCREAFNYP
jgi:hypothetical protein